MEKVGKNSNQVEKILYSAIVHKYGRCYIIPIIIFGVTFVLQCAKSPPTIQWKKTLPTDARGFYVQQTRDNGYIVIGGKKESGFFTTDIYLLKTDSLGNTLWERNLGNLQSDDQAFSIQQTRDGGYIMAGIGGDTSKAYLIKTDKLGNLQWEIRKFPLSNASIVQQTIDGGYITAGITESSDEGLIYIMKIDSLGNFKWKKVLPDSYYLYYEWTGFVPVQQTRDGGYIIGSEALTKTDSLGNIQWRRSYNKIFVLFSVLQTIDGGYIATGIGTKRIIKSLKDKRLHDLDICLLKTDSLGNQLWQKMFGGKGDERGCCIKKTKDSGYFISGDLNGDAYVLKTDSLGNLQWSKLLGVENKWAWSGQPTLDGGYIIIADEQLVKLAPENK